jgi:hypothetical protein
MVTDTYGTGLTVKGYAARISRKPRGFHPMLGPPPTPFTAGLILCHHNSPSLLPSCRAFVTEL